MKFTNIRLLVKDMAVSLSFYRDTLGMKVIWGTTEEQYVELQLGENATLALFGQQNMADAVGASHLPASAECQDRFALIFGVEDVDAYTRQLQERGVTLAAAPQNHPDWMLRTAHFRDPDGNLIEINAPLHTAA